MATSPPIRSAQRPGSNHSRKSSAVSSSRSTAAGRSFAGTVASISRRCWSGQPAEALIGVDQPPAPGEILDVRQRTLYHDYEPALPGRPLPAAQGSVLAPFRHHRSFRRRFWLIRTGAEEVPNAFRHHSLFRSRAPRRGPSTRSRAQRLFGITVYCRSSAHARRNAPQHVLNAFRHHGIISVAPDHTLTLCRHTCSTPFGITEYIGEADGVGQLRNRVLNAFRHHGIYRSRRHPAPLRDLPVLNAFRHHGIYRPVTIHQPAPGFGECSTPFGITEYIGQFEVETSTDAV